MTGHHEHDSLSERIADRRAHRRSWRRTHGAYDLLGCADLTGTPNPVTLTTEGNGVVTDATFANVGGGGWRLADAVGQPVRIAVRGPLRQPVGEPVARHPTRPRRLAVTRPGLTGRQPETPARPPGGPGSPLRLSAGQPVSGSQ